MAINGSIKIFKSSFLKLREAYKIRESICYKTMICQWYISCVNHRLS